MDSKLAFVLVILSIIPSGFGLKCYVCNNIEKCGDPFYQGNQSKTRQFLMQCPNDDKEYFCEKAYKYVEGEKLVDRKCEELIFKNHESKCYWREHGIYICQCFEDGCNSASMLSKSSLISTLLVAYLMQ